MKISLFLVVIIFSTNLHSQLPISQIEGYLEIHHPHDSTSIYVGKGSGQMVDTALTKRNTFFGQEAGKKNDSGQLNTFVGNSAGYSSIHGDNNSFFGVFTGQNNTYGHYNSFFGSSSGLFNTSGYGNSYFGSHAGSATAIGDFNSFFGYRAGYYMNGSQNICIGAFSGPPSGSGTVVHRLFIDTEASNTPLIYGEFDNDILAINGNLGVDDHSPGHIISLGQSLANTKLALYESDADPNSNYGLGVTSGTFRFNIGNPNAQYSFFDAPGASANEVFNIRGSGALYASGLRFIGDHNNLQYNSSTGEIGYDNSSRRYKQNITTLQDDWRKILMTRPVKYTRAASPSHWEYGYIAEEMDSIGLTNLVGYDAQGLPDDVKYDRMVLYLSEIVKQHHLAIQQLLAENAVLSKCRSGKQARDILVNREQSANPPMRNFPNRSMSFSARDASKILRHASTHFQSMTYTLPYMGLIFMLAYFLRSRDAD